MKPSEEQDSSLNQGGLIIGKIKLKMVLRRIFGLYYIRPTLHPSNDTSDPPARGFSAAFSCC